MIGFTSRTTSPWSVVSRPQHPVGGGVVRADVDREQLVGRARLASTALVP